jgi:putative oxidoreductase
VLSPSRAQLLAHCVLFRANFADQNQLIHFMKNVATAGRVLVLASFGAGPISVDGEANLA